MAKRAVVGATTAAAVVVVAALGGIWWRHGTQERAADRASEAQVTAFAADWSKRDFTVGGVYFAGSTPDAVTKAFATATAGLGSGPVTARADQFRRDGDRASATVHVTWTLAGDVPWSYDVPVTATRPGGQWAIQLPTDRSPWHPALGAKDRLSATRTWGARGDLLDRKGQPLAPMGKVYPVQIDPTRATPAGMAQLEKVVDEPKGSLAAKLAAARKAGSQTPIPVITYRQSDFDQRKDQLDAILGVIYPARQQPLAKSRTFLQPLLGSFGPVSAELVKKSNGRYAAGDLAGVSGLQGQYDSVLGGTPGVKVTSSAKPDSPLFEEAAVDGTDVKTTLDPAVQGDAEAALKGSGDVPSALVALDVRTGAVLASANSPAFGRDRAITGRYAPGSSFKIVTTYSLLTQGKVTPSTTVTCPKTFVVDGRHYKNYEGEELGQPSFADDFAHSCNTAFVQLAGKLADGDLAKAADQVGITGWAKGLGVANAFDASIPANNGKTDKASAAIGQGRDEVSPIALAVLAGNVARGSALAPTLVTDPAPPQTPTKPAPLDAKAAGVLQDLTAAVVDRGTGQVLKGTPGGPVHGKTGTAEFGTRNPPQTHAWFVGYQGDIAFAVLVEEGKSGGTVAAPLVKKFLTSLAR
jgi:cell division protein FtsI/penicillin-binding protein 2